MIEPISKKRSKKEVRALRVLLGLVELYIQEGKPVGSHTLKENGFDDLSSATIRNYFTQLEAEGYLTQPHASGGRIPTEQAFRHYASEMKPSLDPDDERQIRALESVPTRNVAAFLHQAAELIGEMTGLAAFLSSVRFDHDFILDIKLVAVDSSRLLSVLITDFGQVLTETLATSKKLSSFTLKRLESYFQWRLKGGSEPSLTEEELALAKELYNEIMVRYIVRYSNFSDEDLYRSGFSRLLAYQEFNDPVALATGLSLFENSSHMRLLLGDCTTKGALCTWIGSDLAPYATASARCSVIALPYRINQITAGALGVLGPCRIPYPQLCGKLQLFSEVISKALTKSLYKFKLSFRHPRSGTPYLKQEENKLLEKKETL